MKSATATQQTRMNQEKFEKLFSNYGKLVFRAAYGENRPVVKRPPRSASR